MKVSRRAFFGSCAAAAVGVPALAATRITTFETKLEHANVTLRSLPRNFPGIRIAFATDLHFSNNISFEFLAENLELLAEQAADVTVWGGDFVAVNGSTLSRTASQIAHKFQDSPLPYNEQANALAARLGELMRIRSDGPSVAVRGNHEIWVAPQQLASAVRSSGVNLLINETKRFSHAGVVVEIAGVDDFWNGIPAPPNFSSDAGLKIVVSHNPDYIAILERNGLVNFDLALCGHTHGGQVRLPVIGALTYNAGSRFVEGVKLVDAGNGFQPGGPCCYTSRGLGVVELPLRINCPPEITILDVAPA